MFSQGKYKAHKKKIYWAFALNLIIALPVVWSLFIEPLIGGKVCYCNETGRLKSRLKQIGTTVAMYYTDGGPTTFPEDPGLFEFDPSIMYDADQSSWETVQKTSPFYFFAGSDRTYEGSPTQYLAIQKKPDKRLGIHFALFQDGHVENISPQRAAMAIMISEEKRFEKLRKENAQ